MTLQEWFYVLGIIFMVVSLLMVIAILSALLVIKTKINHLHQVVTDKVDKVRGMAEKGATIVRTMRHFVKM